jgi:hypothetical protein
MKIVGLSQTISQNIPVYRVKTNAKQDLSRKKNEILD